MSKIQSLTDHSTKKVVYSDFFTDFSRNSVTGQLNKKTNAEAVKQSIRNLLLTNRYERPFQPEIGSGLTGLLFENYTPGLELRAKKMVEEVFDNHEPRAELLNVTVGGDPDRNSLSFQIHFRIINTTEPETLEIILERTR
jgi:phage baseplate assembly protein W|tara:strand:- start:90 stop:509 length:420 start_codon:yes stop_codon:yes gene_type:complete